MKIITDCQVHLLTTMQLHPHPEYELPPDGEVGERIAAMGGKVCYDTYGVDGNPVVSHCVNLNKQDHWSVFEHVCAGVVISGVSRGLSHELVRHRLFAYSQRSTRYTDEANCAIVLEPYLAKLYRLREEAPRQGLMPGEARLLERVLNDVKVALYGYEDQVNLLMSLAPDTLSPRDLRKWARGKARQILPHCLETRLVMTGNMRAWREMLLKRTSKHAEPEIRRLAEKLYATLRPVCPAAFSDLDEIPEGDASRGERFISLVRQPEGVR
jgi:thymidylate synthase (FAD)